MRSFVLVSSVYLPLGNYSEYACSDGCRIFLNGSSRKCTCKTVFSKNSNRYKPVLSYFKMYWQLVVTNFLYILGLYVHNFVFWTTDMRMVVVDSFVCNQPYDMASCLAMFTNISATIIFIARVEMYFHEKYKLYSEAVIGGRGADIQNAKKNVSSVGK